MRVEPAGTSRASRQLALHFASSSTTTTAGLSDVTMAAPPVTAMDAIAALSGKLPADDFVARLVTQRIDDAAAANDLWRVAAQLQDADDHAALALTLRHDYVQRTVQPEDSGRIDCGNILERIKTYAAHCAFQTHGDAYVAMALKAMLPAPVTVLCEHMAAPYAAGAEHWGRDANKRIRPLLCTPIPDVIDAASWSPTDLRGLFAAVVTMREITGGQPAVYIDTEIAFAPPSEFAIAVCRAPLCGGGIGVLHNNVFTRCKGPLETVALWANKCKI